MTTYVVKIEGRNNIPVPEDVAKDEQKLRRALSMVVNGIADAKIEYHDEKDGVVESEVIKRAGAKGYDPSEPEGQFGSQDLILRGPQRRKGGRNPAIKFFLELRLLDTKTLDSVHMLDIGTQVDQAKWRTTKPSEVARRALRREGGAGKPEPRGCRSTVCGARKTLGTKLDLSMFLQEPLGFSLREFQENMSRETLTMLSFRVFRQTLRLA